MDKTTWRGGESDLADWIAMQKHEGSMSTKTIKRTVLEPVTQPIAPTRTPVAGLLPQLFLFRWNNSKAKTASQSKYIMHEAWGTKYPNGVIALDYKLFFNTRTEMIEHFEPFGEYHIQELRYEVVEEGETPA